MELFKVDVLGRDFLAVAQELVLLSFALGVLLLGVILKGDRRRYTGYVALFGYVLAFLPLLGAIGRGYEAFSGMVVLDPFSLFFKVLILVVGFLVVLLSLDYTSREGIAFGEYYALVLLASAGMMLMAGAAHLVTLFLGLEIMSIAIYALAGIMREDARSVEAAFKYFLLGAFASGFLLYGMALTYASTGALHLREIEGVLAQKAWLTSFPLVLVGLGLLLVGFGFKLALVPFHMWTPDVYEGAPTSITAFMATGVKAAAFAGLLRVFFTALPALEGHWRELLWVLAVATMTLGNLVALRQEDVKRMLAYSSIAHAGYIMVGFVAATELGRAAVLFYLFAYAFMNIGAFAVVALLGRRGAPNTLLEDYAGVGFKHPLLAVAMAVFLFSLAGVPPTAGFMAKFYVFSAAVKAGYYWLAVLGVLNSAVAAYYYLRVMVYMYFREPKEGLQTGYPSFAGAVAILIALWGVFQLGIMPSDFLALAQRSVQVF
ncbi:MAG: NADH-quinone oxidoreductase subunit N [Deltaproteobacteria bacterium]|nr:MAG: NADH-quinone oxidoreductase subunit N [Deltaproteobacteria bacterium]RLB02997.1 MAG: NADH-quinone oxidoreductase subunit N [Deltaproteobacteria bacterium]